ncbi:hypothetical protein [Paremcibacter congregatus]|uniref:hypothetical protein n=1 Tax=Paremcibacter congregatus TaxID=2043170 RepID=UPI003A94A6BB
MPLYKHFLKTLIKPLAAYHYIGLLSGRALDWEYRRRCACYWKDWRRHSNKTPAVVRLYQGAVLHKAFVRCRIACRWNMAFFRGPASQSL